MSSGGEAGHDFEKATMDIKEAYGLIQEGLDRVDNLLLEIGTSDDRQITEVAHYALGYGGKRIRPALFLLSAGACGYDDPRIHAYASVFELIHTATLLHDDVVDSATMRRGRTSPNSRWGNDVSVLVGNFLISRAYQILVDHEDMGSLRTLTAMVTNMVDGEVLQLRKIGDLDLPEAEYFDAMVRKTAGLLSATCHVAADISQSPPECREALRRYGQQLGIAFQLIDDVLDYAASENNLGKQIGHDLLEGKATLPLLATLAKSDDAERALVASALSADQLDRKTLERIIALVNEKGGDAYARQRAAEYAAQAKGSLSALPRSDAVEALEAVADYVLYRDR